MPSLPAKTSFTDNTTTEGGFRTSFDNMIDYLTNKIGTTDTYVAIISGTTGTRPGAGASGWLRFNTTTTEMEVSIGTAWNKLMHFTTDATYKWLLTVTQEAALKIYNSGSTACKIQVASSAQSIDLGVDADEGYINTTHNALRLWVGSSAMAKLTNIGDLDVVGNVTASGSITISDKRLKKDIRPIKNGLSIVRKLEGYTFTKKRNNEKSAGVIAQDVLLHFPRAIRPFKEDDETYLAVEYSALIGPMIESIKELEQRIKDLEARNDDSK